ERVDGTHLASFREKIEFKNVSFGYGGAPVLKDLNLTIPFGSKVGIVGESGSGKSTLVNLLFRFYDVSGGQIVMDGHDLRDMKLASLRQQMALVSQEVLLFNRSVADNIAYGKAG